MHRPLHSTPSSFQPIQPSDIQTSLSPSHSRGSEAALTDDAAKRAADRIDMALIVLRCCVFWCWFERKTKMKKVRSVWRTRGMSIASENNTSSIRDFLLAHIMSHENVLCHVTG